MKLPEFQFIVKRITDQGKRNKKIRKNQKLIQQFKDSLPPPLKIQEDLDNNKDIDDENELKNEDFEILPELQEYLDGLEGGQVWGSNITESRDIKFYYYLGSAIKEKQSKEIKKIHCSSENKPKKLKKSNRKRKSTRNKAIKNNQKNKKQNNETNEENQKNQNLRSDEELFVNIAPWRQNTLMVSYEGNLWFKLGEEPPKLLEYQPPIPVCSVACGKSHALALTSKYSIHLI